MLTLSSSRLPPSSRPPSTSTPHCRRSNATRWGRSPTRPRPRSWWPSRRRFGTARTSSWADQFWQIFTSGKCTTRRKAWTRTRRCTWPWRRTLGVVTREDLTECLTAPSSTNVLRWFLQPKRSEVYTSNSPCGLYLTSLTNFRVV